MTHYILCGGSDRKYSTYGERLAAQVKAWNGSPLHVLSCQFAKPESDWSENLESWGVWFKECLGVETTVELATPERFIEQAKTADVIFLHGGRTQTLVDAMEPFHNVEQMFDGKIIIGSSAGTNYLSKTYYSPKQRMMHEGTSIVPLNTVVHYGAEGDGEVSLTQDEWQRVVDEMKDKVGHEEIILLPEGEFVVFEK